MRSHAKASSAGLSTGRAIGLGRIVRGASFAPAFLGASNGSGARPDRRTRMVLTAFALSAALLLLLAPAAPAAKSVVKTLGGPAGSTGGAFSGPRGIAINTTGNGGVAAGTFYVADASNLRIQRFSPTAGFLSTWGWDVNGPDDGGAFETCTVAAECIAGDFGGGAGQFAAAAQGLGIDQSNGILYVADQNNKRIDAFSATGAFEGAFGWGVVDGTPALQFCTATCVGGLAGGGSGQFGNGIGGITIDGSHTVYVADKTNRRVDVFTPTITAGVITGVSFARAFGWDVADTGDPGDTAPVNQFEVCTTACKAGATGGTGLGQFGNNSPADVALDSSGHLYALDSANKRIEKFDLSTPASPTLIPAPAFDASAAIGSAFGATPGNLYGLGYDATADHLYVSGSNSTTSPANQLRIAELSSSGALVNTHGADLTVTTSAGGLAVAPESLGGNIYLSSTNGGQRVFILNFLPAVSLKPVTTRSRTTATLEATVNPLGNQLLGCTFQYSLDKTTWTDAAGTDCSAFDPEGGAQPLLASISGLVQETTYYFRLHVETTGGASLTSPEKSFTTRGKPIVSATAASKVTETGATLSAQINPDLEETTYHFEYVDDATFQLTGFDEATLLPFPEGSAGAGESAVSVSVELTGLDSGTLYHFRLLATSGGETSESPELTFRTLVIPEPFAPCANDLFRTGAGSGLPDCRAYEQASPVDKNGGNVTGKDTVVRASSTGDKVIFQATAPIPGGEGSQAFDPLYLASRGSGGWSTQGLQPPQSEGEEATLVGWTPDLSHTFGWVRRFGIPNMTALLDRDTNDGSLRTIVPHTPAARRPQIVGSSSDGSLVFFENGGIENGGALTESENAAPAGSSNLYVWDREAGTVRLAGVLNDGKAPPNGAFGGSYWWEIARPDIGGATFKSYTVDQHAVAPDGSSVYFTAAKTGQLYLRLNPAEPQSEVVVNSNDEEECTQPALACTIHVSASNKHNGGGLEGNDSAGPHPAAFMGASADGKLSFFTSSEMLTNKSNTGSEQAPAQIGRAKAGATEAEEVKPGLLFKHAVGVATSPDGEYLYWADPQAGTIGRAKLNGDGQPSEVEDEFIVPGPTEFETHPKTQPGVLIATPATPRYVAVDDEYVYWTNTGPLAAYGGPEEPVETAGTIGRAKLNGSEPPLEAEIEPEFITGASDPQGIAVDSEHIYWANRKAGGFGEDITGPGGWVSRSDLEGESVQAKFFNPNSGSGQKPATVALTSTDLYIATNSNSEDGSLYRVPLEGGPSESRVVGTGLSGGNVADIEGIAIVGPYIYWTSHDDEVIGRKPLDGIGKLCDEVVCETEYVKLEGQPFGLATDGERLYWAVNGEAPGNPGNDLYRYDAAKGKLSDLTVDADDANGAEVKGVLGASEDGSYVYFVARGALAAGASPGTENLYLHHEGQSSFIAQLGGGDFKNWEGTAITTAGDQPKISRVSADGRTLLFTSPQKLTAYENEGTPELYLYRVGEPGLLCISCNPTGLPPSGTPSLGSSYPEVLNLSPAPVMSRNLSADGKRVFFESPEAMVSADINGYEGCPKGACQDVYEWEAKGEGSCNSEAQNGGCIYLISTGKSGDPSYLIDASRSGDDVFFFTRSQLSGQDEDSFIDVYDARVGGGLASQNEAPPPPPCEGESCKRGATPATQSSSPTTSLFSGPGNPKAHHKAAKRKRHRKHRKHRRHAKTNGRAHR